VREFVDFHRRDYAKWVHIYDERVFEITEAEDEAELNAKLCHELIAHGSLIRP
jgi:hypothetical protein